MAKNENTRKIVIWVLSIIVVAFGIEAAIYYGTDFFKTITLKTSDNIGFSAGKGSKTIDQNKTEQADGIKNISISSVSPDIKLTLSDDNSINAHFYGKVSSSSKAYNPELVMEKSGDELKIRLIWPKTFVLFLSQDLKLDVQIPKAYSENLKIETTSANFNSDALNLKDFYFRSVSGDLINGLINCENAKISTTSGNIKFNGKCGNNFEAKSVSGDLTCDFQGTNITTVSTTSGRIELKGLTGSLDSRSVSGDLKAEFWSFENDIRVSSTSGNSRIKLPADAQFNIDFKAVSGKISMEDFSAKIIGSSSDDNKLKASVGDSSNDIVINSVSGDCEIFK